MTSRCTDIRRLREPEAAHLTNHYRRHLVILAERLSLLGEKDGALVVAEAAAELWQAQRRLAGLGPGLTETEADELNGLHYIEGE